MSINTKLRLTILASAFALAAAAPAAFAQGTGTWYKGIHTDPPSGSVDHDPAIHTRQVMEKKIVPSYVVPYTGTWYQGIHTDPSSGSVDHDPAIHTKQLMEKKIVPSQPAANEVAKSIQLKDGSTVHVFGDGKMAMEDKFGRAAPMEPGHTMEARDGKQIKMNGNEVMELDRLLLKKHGNNA